MIISTTPITDAVTTYILDHIDREPYNGYYYWIGDGKDDRVIETLLDKINDILVLNDSEKDNTKLTINKAISDILFENRDITDHILYSYILVNEVSDD